MSIKEADRLGVMRQVDRKALTIKKAGEQLGLSARQLRQNNVSRWIDDLKTDLLSSWGELSGLSAALVSKRADKLS